MAKSDAEPSVEEILASIKKVIAQDGRQAALARGREMTRKSIPDDTVDEDDGVLELTGDLEPTALDESESDGEEELVSEDKRSAMRQSLAALSTMSEPRAAPKIVQSGETSLEGMVREMLKPMLAEWLDANLPGLVETMVAREISKITRKG